MAEASAMVLSFGSGWGKTPAISLPNAPVAQLDRAPDFESVGRTFESCRARQSSNQAGQHAPAFFLADVSAISAVRQGATVAVDRH